MKKVKRIVQGSKRIIKQAPSFVLRSMETSSLNHESEKFVSESNNNKKPSVSLVFLSGAAVSEKDIKKIESGLSDQFVHESIVITDNDISINSLNKLLLNIKTEYIVFLNTVNSVVDNWLDTLYLSLTRMADSGVVGGRSYYSQQSGLGYAYLTKQSGVSPKHRVRVSNIPEFTLIENNHFSYKWDKNTDCVSMEIPSTDIVILRTSLFKEYSGFNTNYVATAWNFILADLCLWASAKGYHNYLCRGCIASVKKALFIQTKHNQNRDVFQGRWYLHLLLKQKNQTHSNNSLNPREIDICGPMPDDDSSIFWGDYHFCVALKKALVKLGFSVNIVTREHWYDESTAKTVIVLRGVRPYYRAALPDGKFLIYWNISHPASISPNELNQANYVFFASQIMQDRFFPDLHVPSAVLPQCTDPEVMSFSGEATLSPELLFVGNSRHVFRRILKDLIPTNHKLVVYGRHWEEFPEVSKYVKSNYLDNDKVSEYYHNAGILLNDHWQDMLEYGIVSNRIFDALASGAFVISDNVAGIHELLGECIVTYTDKEDLHMKIDYYLSHPKERDCIAALGRDLVKKKHTFDVRAKNIAKIIEQTI